jgi:flagellar biosynthesis/type III secretory pathway chaperone
MPSPWESELTEFLRQLGDVQEELFAVLSEKRSRMVTGRAESLGELEGRERELIERLEACQQRRGELLAQAEREGLPCENVRAAAAALPLASRRVMGPALHEAARRMRLLQHQSLVNWVLAQRAVLHVAQLLEIIATGGRTRPTYGKGEVATQGGSFVDQAV